MLRDEAEYHVTARINRGEMIFMPKEDKELFLRVLQRAKKKFLFQVKNFCIMGNHIHLLIKPGKGESLSKIMQWILSVFAMAWNRTHQLSGHLWGERFFSRIITGIQDFLKIFAYIDANPVLARLVEHPGDWEYGGLWHHKTGRSDIVDEPDALAALFSPEHLRFSRP